MLQKVYFVGTTAEVEHHAAPLRTLLEYQIVSPEEIAATATAGDLAIFYSEHFDRFRATIQDLKAKNVATLYMLDGILEWRNAWENRDDEPASPFTMRPVLSDKIAAIGPAQARLLAGWGNASRVEVVGVPRFDRYRELQKRVGDDGNFRLLVTTAKCPSYTPEQNRLVLASLKDLKAYLEQSTKIEVVWRLTGELERELQVNNELTDLTGVELSHVLQTVDAVVSTPSTVVLEAMLLNLPTAVLDYTNSPDYVRTAWNITAPNHISPQLKQLQTAEACRLQFQQQILADELYLESSATNRMQELIAAMLAASRECLQQQRPVQFPASLLSVPTYAGIPSRAFEHRDLYPEYEEFRERETTVLQAEWAHARREIQHLQRQITQLRAELGDAHQIFDQIHDHPIAGPIVRTREKMLRWMNKFKPVNPTPHEPPPLS